MSAPPPGAHWTDPFSPRTLIPPYRGGDPLFPWRGREPHHSGHCILASVASPHQPQLPVDHLFLSLILHPSHCRQEPPPSPRPHHAQDKTHPRRPTSQHVAATDLHAGLSVSPDSQHCAHWFWGLKEKKKKRGKNTLALDWYLDTQKQGCGREKQHTTTTTSSSSSTATTETETGLAVPSSASARPPHSPVCPAAPDVHLMSSPSHPADHAHAHAAAPAAPVSPASPCPAAGSSPPLPRQDQEPQQDDAAAAAVVPGPAVTPPAHQGLATPVTSSVPHPSPSPSSGDHIKYQRAPTVQRPAGPSLLTQALATARGIGIHPSPARPEQASRPKPTTTPSFDQALAASSASHSPQQSAASRDSEGQEARHASSQQPDDECLTPRPTTMPCATTTTTTTVTYPSGRLDLSTPKPYNLDLGEVNSVLSGHRDFLSKSKSRPQLERKDSETRGQSRPSHAGIPTLPLASAKPLASPTLIQSPSTMQANGEPGYFPETPQDPKQRKLEHRVTLGPEKAWSLNTGEAADSGDGQVEKSVTEAISGVEHSARSSRKASHSLGFFKQGNPEEKSKRKETRTGTIGRDKLPPTVEAPAAERDAESEGVSSGPLSVSDSTTLTIPKLLRTRSYHGRTPDVPPTTVSPQDDAHAKSGQKPDVEIDQLAPSPALVRAERQVSSPDEATAPETVAEPDAARDICAEICEVTEEGEESGEEKISSAVFLPHQGPEQSEEETETELSSVPPRTVPTPHDGDFHPWLVKAGEPEAEAKVDRVDFEKRKVRAEPAEIPTVAPEVDTSQAEASAIADESEVGLRPKPSRPVSQYQEEPLHDHQWAPKQPLDAIELIPYRHQVGGHTTLWRFSRRAVCKQLNNRENEFYEKIEKYHRDLLAFLPRYDGSVPSIGCRANSV